jgi:alpha-L-fucosidase
VGRGSTLLLNIPPDRRGLIHENDLRALKDWKDLLDKEFKTNYASEAKTKASNHRGDLDIFASNNATDGNRETYWATDDGITNASIEVRLDDTRTVKYIVVQEYIKLGQRVKSFTVDAWVNGSWTPLANGTTIGYKRILRVEPIETNKIRISITDAKACPLISNVEVY